MEYESAFLIKKQSRIISKLQVLLKKKCLLTVQYGNPNKTFITTILEIILVDSILIFYYATKKDDINELFTSEKISFKGDYLGVKFAFDAFKINEYKHNGLSSFATLIPDRLLWLEARVFYRLKTVASLYGYCHLTLENNPEPLKFKLLDISIAGFSMVIDSPEISTLMVPKNYSVLDCKILLEQTGEGTVSIEVRNKSQFDDEDQKRIVKIGCKFTKISPTFEDIIHLHMGKLEREKIGNYNNLD